MQQILQSTPEQKKYFEGAMELASSLQFWERSLILKIIECCHIPHVFHYLLRNEKEEMLAAVRSEEFISAVFVIVREAVIFGTSEATAGTGAHVSSYTEAEIVAYSEHKPRALSFKRMSEFGDKTEDRFLVNVAFTLLDNFRLYLRDAQRRWPTEWTHCRFSDFVNIQRQIPAAHEERMKLIRRLMTMRLARIPNALSVLEREGESIGEMSDLTLLSSLDASILAITEQYLSGIEQGFDDAVVFQWLVRIREDSHRLSGQNLPSFDPPFTFGHFMMFYLQHAHSHGIRIDPGAIPVAVRSICAFYGRHGSELM